MRLPPCGPTGNRRPRGAGLWLALAAGWMAIAAVLPGSAGLVALAVGVIALAAAAVFAVRAQWLTIQAEGALIAPVVVGDEDDAAGAAELTLRLRRLREQHVARVDAALDDGRPDVARALSDAYIDAALHALTDRADAPT
jgi:hypothetical protein